MRLHPSVTEAEAHAWLTRQVEALHLATLPENLEEELTLTAQAMASISRTILSDEQEPLFP